MLKTILPSLPQAIIKHTHTYLESVSIHKAPMSSPKPPRQDWDYMNMHEGDFYHVTLLRRCGWLTEQANCAGKQFLDEFVTYTLAPNLLQTITVIVIL